MFCVTPEDTVQSQHPAWNPCSLEYHAVCVRNAIMNHGRFGLTVWGWEESWGTVPFNLYFWIILK